MAKNDRFPHFIELNPELESGNFKSFIQRAKAANKYGAAVDVHKVEDYKKMRLFTTGDGLAGYAVQPTGEITSVFRHPQSKYRHVSKHAAEHAQLIGGATHASAFDPSLPQMYGHGGLSVLSHVQWNEEFKPKNWKVSFQGRPDVAFLAVDPNRDKSAEYTPGSSPEAADYDAGMAGARAAGEAARKPRPANATVHLPGLMELPHMQGKK